MRMVKGVGFLSSLGLQLFVSFLLLFCAHSRRQSQSQAFARLAKAYDQSNNNNSNKHLTSHLVHLMQEVQEYGQPPPDLIQTIAPGLSLDADGLPNLGQDDCRTM